MGRRTLSVLAALTLLLLLAGAALAAAAPRWSGPLSAHFDGARFVYPGDPFDKSWREILRFATERDRGDWSARAIAVRDTPLPDVHETGVQLTPINHATVLVRTATLSVLTDPIWSERASPVSWAGPKRRHAPGLPFELLPKIDVVVISHNHYDHFDLPTLKQLAARDDPQFVVPAGDGALLREAGIGRVVELDWNQAWIAPDGCAIHALRSKHWSSRNWFDRNRSLWAAYVIETAAGPIYFGGDTGYDDHFRDARERHGAMRVALLPIGAFEPRWFLQWQHMSPDDAVQAHRDLAAHASLGIHFGTFELADDGPEDAAQELARARHAAGLEDAAFVAPAPGVPLDYAPLADPELRGCRT